MIEKRVAIYDSFSEADEADRRYYHSLTPEERLAIAFELNARWPVRDDEEPAEGLARVCRVVERA